MAKKNVFGEKVKCDRLIVLDDVSGLADDSKKFASSLTVARKYAYNCVYNFHSIQTEKSNWQTILSQTNIYNISPASVSFNSVKKIIEGACIRNTSKYIPQPVLWISRLFIELANKNEKVCLTLDCSNINKDGPGRFRTEADNREFQACYFNSENDEQLYNEFVSQRIKSPSEEIDFHFKIVELKIKTRNNLTFDASEELRNLGRNDTSANKRSKTIFGSGISAEKSYRRPAKRANPGFLT